MTQLNWKPARILLFGLGVCIPALLHGQVRTAGEASSGLRLRITVANQADLAEPLAVKLSLANESSNAIVTPALESGLVKIAVRQMPNGSNWERLHGGSFRAVRQRSGKSERTAFVKVRQPAVELATGQTNEWTFDLVQNFGIRLHPGEYTITAEYENQITAEARLRVEVHETNTVSTLIGLIESGDPNTKMWARNSLFILTGHPEWEMRPDGNEAELNEKLKDLRSWWSANRSGLKLEGTHFVAK